MPRRDVLLADAALGAVEAARAAGAVGRRRRPRAEVVAAAGLRGRSAAPGEGHVPARVGAHQGRGPRVEHALQALVAAFRWTVVKKQLPTQQLKEPGEDEQEAAAFKPNRRQTVSHQIQEIFQIMQATHRTMQI